MKRNVRHWLSGLISAVSGAISAPFGVVVSDQITGQVHNYGLDALATMAVGPAIVALFAYLKQKPLPDDEDTQ